MVLLFVRIWLESIGQRSRSMYARVDIEGEDMVVSVIYGTRSEAESVDVMIPVGAQEGEDEC